VVGAPVIELDGLSEIHPGGSPAPADRLWAMGTLTAHGLALSLRNRLCSPA